MSDDLGAHMEAVARKILGEPNTALSNATVLRWGSHGSLSVDIGKGTWFDHEAGAGGGVLDLIAREKGAKNGAAITFMRDELGIALEERPKREAPLGDAGRIVAEYDYTDEHGELIFQAVRWEPKRFSQRRPGRVDDDQKRVHKGWVWSLAGVKLVPFHLKELVEALAANPNRKVFIVEGEKDVLALEKMGFVATCNPMGAGKWRAEFSDHLRGANAVIIRDNDDAGRSHGEAVAATLVAKAKTVRILDLPGLPPKGDVSDWIARGGTRDELIELEKSEARDFNVERPASHFGAITWSDLDAVEMRQDYLVEDLIFQGDAGMFYGASGSGKSFAALDMALSIARGVPFMGKKTAAGAVIYQAGEGGRGLVKRMKAYRQHHDVTTALPFVLLPARIDLFAADGDLDAFLAECLMWRASLPAPLRAIIIDTFSTASPGANENASEDVGRLLTAGQRLQEATGAAVIWVHHKNAAGDRERGHTSLRANLDAAMEVIRDEDTNERTLRLAKLKDGEDDVRLRFNLQAIEIGAYDDGKPITSCVVVPAQDSGLARSATPRLANGPSRFLKILSEAVRDRGGVIPQGDRAEYGTRGVDWSVFRSLYVNVFGQGRADTALRQALQRDGDKLFDMGLIDREDRWIWLTHKGRSFL